MVELNSDLNADQRVIFTGPSTSILRELHESFILEGDLATIDLNSNKLLFPVFLLDSKAKNPEEVRSCSCKADYIVKVRNSNKFRTFLAIVPNSENLNLSIETTVTRIGYNQRELKNFDEWRNKEIIKYLIDELMRPFEKNSNSSITDLNEILDTSLRRIWDDNNKQGGNKEIWAVIYSLAKHCQNGDRNQFLATLGMPNGTTAQNVINDQNIILKLAELFDDRGFRGAEEQIIESLDAGLTENIRQFCAHIRAKCKWTKSFLNNPLQKYSPKLFQLGEQITLPDWWTALTVEEWHRVFASTTPENQAILDVDILNQMTLPKGMPKSTSSGAHFQFKFKNSLDESVSDNRQLSVYRSVGNKTREFIEDITITNTENTWEDQNSPAHDRYLRYEFEAASISPYKLSIISLPTYQPGIILNSFTAEKVTQFKWNPKGKAPKNDTKRPQYECDLRFNFMGTHTLQIHKSAKFSLDETARGYEIDSEGGSIDINLICESDANYSARVVTDDESKYEFSAINEETNQINWYVINITAGDTEPKGVSSVFEKLIFQNVTDTMSRSLQILPNQSLLNQYFDWAISDPTSFYPVIIGPDVKRFWKIPIWDTMDKISDFQIQHDPRPSSVNFCPPKTLISARNQLLEHLTMSCEDKEKDILLIELSELGKDVEFKKSLEDYVYEYMNWLGKDYDNAIWFDVITFHQKSSSGNVLQDQPTAILLSPLHPVKLAWQTNTQIILADALDKNRMCPAASQINGDHFPRCLCLPIRTALSQSSNIGYFSVGNSSDYWSVLWDTNKIEDLNSAQNLKVFHNDLGLRLEGLTTGFTSSQMTKSLDEMLLSRQIEHIY